MHSPDPVHRRRILPPNGETQWLTMADGWRLRAISWAGQGLGTKGSILLITGRGDFLEKYAEALHDFGEQGWAVAVFDWRGQGGSGRLGRSPMHGYIKDFSLWADDLAEVMAWFHAHCPAPHHAVAHSMGGHLLLRHLVDHPGAVLRAVLLAPMLGLHAAPFRMALVGAAASFVGALGLAQAYLPGGGAYGSGNDGRQALLTSDAERYADERWWVQQRPGLALGSATWGWLAAAARSLRGFKPGRLRTPLLVLMAEHEGLVDNHATVRMLAGRAEIETIAGAAHEMLREASDIRALVLARIEAYFAS